MMTLIEARKVLGLNPGEDPNSNLTQFKIARAEIVKLVSSATSPQQTERFQKGLTEFDEAQQVIKNHLTKPEKTVTSPKAPLFLKTSKPRRRKFSNMAWLMMIAVGAIIGTVIHFYRQNGQPEHSAAGISEEQTKFVALRITQATTEFEQGRLDEAAVSVRQVLDRYPAEKKGIALLDQITTAQADQSRAAMIASAQEALNERKWNEAISNAQQVLASAPENPEARSILMAATAAFKQVATDHEKAEELLEMAIARDHGKYDQQALDWLREAKSLAPENAEISRRLEIVESHSRTIRVPEDIAILADALAAARDKDRVVLAVGTWQGPLFIHRNIVLEGAGFANSTIECSPEAGCPITINHKASGARVSGIHFRHHTAATGTERFSAALVRSGNATFSDCRFTNASGHGFAVIDSGKAVVSRSRFSENGWNGAAVIGNGSQLELRDCESLKNSEHGVESWDGAAVTLINNLCEANKRNGIHADNGSAAAIIEGNQLIGNREFGIVINSASMGKIANNTIQANVLGGLVIRTAASNLTVTGNQTSQNQGPSMMIEKGLTAANYSNNIVSTTNDQQMLTDVIFAAHAEPAATEFAPPRAKVVVETQLPNDD